MKRTASLAAGLALVLSAPAALAEESCKPEEKIERDQYLRRLALDLLGRPPTADEYAAVASEPDVPDRMIDAMLASDNFVARIQRFVYDQVYPSLPYGFLSYSSILVPLDYQSVDPVYWRMYHAQFPYDVMLPDGVDAVYHCADEPAPTPAFDITGQPIPLRTETINGYVQPTYGYVDRHPYWHAERSMKICAIDALESGVSNDGFYGCDTYVGMGMSGCGCGTDLRSCSTYYDHLGYGTEVMLGAAVRAELDWAVRRIVTEDRPWTELFTARETWLSGPLAYFYRYQRYLTDVFYMGVSPVPDSLLETIDYQSAGQMIVRDERNAGILTSPIYLLRHQTSRARVNRFDTSFLCSPYSPPEGGIGDLSNVEPNPDLSVRAKCSYCHARLEERAVAFATVAETGGTFLESSQYPAFRQDCHDCAAAGFASGMDSCDYDCSRNYYVVRDGPRAVLEPQWGKKRELAFRPDTAMTMFEHGPKSLVEGREVDLASCLIQKLGQRVLHRAPEASEADWIAELTASFGESGFKLRPLIKQIVTSKTYRRAP